MKRRILRIDIPLWVMLFGFITGIDIQAYTRIKLVGVISLFLKPIAAAGLTLGF
jgi:hypothetical protein